MPGRRKRRRSAESPAPPPPSPLLTIDCITCLSPAAPPVTLDACGHTLCGECLNRMRADAGTADAGGRRAGFRCPMDRRMVDRFVVSVPTREIARTSYTEEERERDAAFMRRYEAEDAGAALPTPRETHRALLAEAGVEEDDGFPMYLVADGGLRRPLVLPSESDQDFAQITSTLLLPRGSAVQGLHARLVELAMPLLRSARRQRDASVARPPPSLQERVEAAANRVPDDLRMWTPVIGGGDATDEHAHDHQSEHIQEYRYTLYVQEMDEPMRRAFSEHMNQRGVSCRRSERGYLLVLPHDNRRLYTRHVL